MKSILTSLLIVICASFFSQITTPSTIKEVTLYLDGAKITRSTSVQASSKTKTYVISNLSEKIDPKTVRVNSESDIKILSVTTRKNYLTLSNNGRPVAELQDSLKILTRLNYKLQDELDALAQEKELLEINQKIHLEGKLSVAELSQMADFIKKRHTSINKEKTSLRISLDDNNEAIQKIKNHLNANQNTRTKSFNEIVLVAKAKESKKVDLNIEYIVNGAGWVPTYDIRVSDLSEPIKLDYKAQVFNNTGLRWENVNFVLSTSDPRKSATAPSLSPWVIKNNAYRKPQEQVQYYGNGNVNRKQLNKDGMVYEEIEIPQLAMEFKIGEKYTIPSDAKPYVVDVTAFDLNASYKHFAVPKIEEAVFLLARVTGWEDLNLIEGNSNIYFGNNFIGESYINPNGVHDTLDISLGRDNKVSIIREKKRDYTDNKIIGGSKKDYLEYDITVKNTRKTGIEIEILDQVPISGDDDISIESSVSSNVMQNTKTGQLTWNKKLGSGESQKMELKFTIKYPKNMSYAKTQTYKRVRAKF